MPPGSVKIVICDVDGVLTDGRIGIDSEGRELKFFSVADGTGIKYLQRAGIEVGFLSGRPSEAAMHRAHELKVSIVRIGIQEKRSALVEILRQSGREPSELCYVGDDIMDIPCLLIAGFPVAVQNAHPEVQKLAEYVTQARGGEGAVREVAEVILKAQGHMESILERYMK